ncbi:MAG: hypothetical protein WDM92_10235 [Caulobacteraceae bacterium]
MRSITLGLVAALALALSPAIASAASKDKAADAAAAKGHDQGMKEAPPIVQQLNLPCTISDANFWACPSRRTPRTPRPRRPPPTSTRSPARAPSAT